MASINSEADKAFDYWRARTREDMAWQAEVRIRSKLPLMGTSKEHPDQHLKWAFSAGYMAGISERINGNV